MVQINLEVKSQPGERTILSSSLGYGQGLYTVETFLNYRLKLLSDFYHDSQL